MTSDDILAIEPRELTQMRRGQNFADGCMLLQRIVPEQWSDRMKAVIRGAARPS